MTIPSSMVYPLRALPRIFLLGCIVAAASGFNVRPSSKLPKPGPLPKTVAELRRSSRATELGLADTVFSGTEKIEEPNKQASPKAATLTSSTMNLIKAMLGTGALALPYGVAAVSNKPIALVPTSILLLVLGVFSAYTFHLYGRLAHETQGESMGEVWERTVGEKSSWIISAATFSFCFGVAWIYALVIGDFLTSLAMSLGSSVPTLATRRQFWILSVTLTTLYPLSTLKSLAALAPMSILGTVGTLLTTIFLAFRCPAIVPTSPYSVAPGAVGKFAATAAPSLVPDFGTYSRIVSPAALIIASMATTAYLGHFNAPEFYHGLKQSQSSDAADAAMSDYGKMTAFGFAGTTMMNIIIMSLGFLTFGGNSAGVILNNYATADKGATISRLLMTISVIGGYPFMVGGCKAGFVQLYNKFKKGKKASQANVEKWVVRGVVCVTTSLALLISDAGLVVSLLGALMGSALIYVFPAIMFLSHTGTQIKASGGNASQMLKLERFTSRFLVTLGIASGLVGAAVSIINACAPHLLR